MNNIKLSDGHTIPQIGIGLWQVDPKVTKNLILNAYKIGYRHIDTAQYYNNEYEVGLAVEKLPREKIFITTKVWVRNFTNREDFLTSVKQSLLRLKVKQVDLLLLHYPIKDKIIEPYRWLEEAKDLGYAKSIGVSNFMISHLEQVLKIAKYKPVVNQIEIQPLVQQKALVAFCRAHNIAVTGYSNINTYVHSKFTAKEKSVIEKIAREVGKTGPEVILRWVYQEGIIIIPKSIHVERLQTNLQITNFELSHQQMQQIHKLDHNNYTYVDEIYEGKGWAKEELKKPNLLFDQHYNE